MGHDGSECPRDLGMICNLRYMMIHHYTCGYVSWRFPIYENQTPRFVIIEIIWHSAMKSAGHWRGREYILPWPFSMILHGTRDSPMDFRVSHGFPWNCQTNHDKPISYMILHVRRYHGVKAADSPCSKTGHVTLSRCAWLGFTMIQHDSPRNWASLA